MSSLSRAFIGDSPEAIAEYKTGISNAIMALGEQSGFGSCADASLKFRKEHGGKDVILDWYKFAALKERIKKQDS